MPFRFAQQYIRGVLTGTARAEARLKVWEGALRTSVSGENTTGCFQRILDVGCGTAPLLVAFAQQMKPDSVKIAGVDIAFRWLVAAKKRVAEAGFDLPLICACAEALPFPDNTFDCVATESVLENASDRRAMVSEINRVMRSEGVLYVSTPNKYSPGPDPHVGIWGGSLLPTKWLAAIVRRQGGIPPQRHLLSAGSLTRLFRKAGLRRIQFLLPQIPEQQRNMYGVMMRWIIDLYNALGAIPISRNIMLAIGPILQAIAFKESVHG